MKSLKKTLSVTLIASLTAALLAGCSGNSKPADPVSGSAPASSSASGGKQVVLKVANYYAESHPQNIILKEKFKPMLEEATNGSIKVELYPNNQLGAEKEFTEGVKAGTIEMGILGTLMSDKYPVLKVAELPFLFDNVDQGYKILNDNLAEITKDMANEGMTILGISVNGVRAVSNSKKPIYNAEDMKGMKMRIPQNTTYIEMGKALGWNCVTMALSEVFTSLQQKVIDGQENPPTTVLASGWNEAQKYLAITDHCVAYNYVAVNTKFFNSLTKEQQDALKEAVKTYTDEEVKLYKESAQKDIETLKSKGMEVTYPDRESFKQIVLAAYDKMVGPDKTAQDMVKKIQELTKTIK